MVKWNSVTSEFGIEPQSGALDVACRAMTQLQEFIQDTHSLIFDYDARLRYETEKGFGTSSMDNLWGNASKTLSIPGWSILWRLLGPREEGRLTNGPRPVAILWRPLFHRGPRISPPDIAAIDSFRENAAPEKTEWRWTPSDANHALRNIPANREIYREFRTFR